MSRDLRDLLDGAVDGPSRPLDLAVVAAGARRQTRRRRAAVAGGTVLAVIAAAVVVPGVLGGPGPAPDIADQPQVAEVDIPDGWVTLTAGELAISVPPTWDVEINRLPDEPVEDVYRAGPCISDLEQPGTRPDDDRSRAVVYDNPSDGACNLALSPRPDRPGIVLHAGLYGSVDGVDRQPGAELVDIDERAVRDRLGAVEVWRSLPSDPDDEYDRFDEDLPEEYTRGVTVETYVAAQLIGGLWVADPDDPEVQDIVATLRPAPGAVPEERPIPERHRDLDPDDWEALAVRATPEYLGPGRVSRTQAKLDDLWMRLRFDDDGPRLPDGMTAIAGATYAGGLPGGCHHPRDVIGVRIDSGRPTILLGPLSDGWAEDDCSDDAFVHIVAVPDDVATSWSTVRTAILDADGEHAEPEPTIDEVQAERP